jgi:gliding motility-associated protein GldC
MTQSSIKIDVLLDTDKVPEQISWSASDTTADDARKAKAMMLAFWDGQDKAALRIDLWTKEMMVDEMGDFFYQTLISMADTLERATRQKPLGDDLRHFAKGFYQRFREAQLKENKV